MTYNDFKQTMIAIKKGNNGIWIGDQGPYNNEDAKLKMGYALSFVPLEYCERLLADPDVVNLVEEAA